MVGANAADRGPTVVELYTSQGCSSCPPADAYLGELAKRPGLLALSFHVDYWDYIGWKDPFADPRHTARQRAFSVIFSQRYVYTPQMVVQGSYQVVGSKPDVIEKAIAKAEKMPSVAVALTKTGDTYQIELPSRPEHKGINVIVVFFDAKHDTKINRGENSGSQLANYNVVRDLREMGQWNGEAKTMSFQSLTSKGEHCAVLLQDAQSGQIVGAGKLAELN